MSETTVHGRCDDRFQAVRSALEHNLDNEDELGASLVVNIHGEDIVDLWGGYQDSARTVPWEANTITNVWSTTKTVTCLAALMLADQGELDVYAPVAEYWPEFAANGKEAVEVRHILAHTSGVSGWDAPFSTEDMYDWQKSTAQLAAQAPWWQPGTASGYHAHNQGHLIGEVVRRITGQDLKQFVNDEIAGPLNADFQIGARDEDATRVAEIVPPPPLPIDMSAIPADHPMMKTFMGPQPNAEAANTTEWRHADLGALNGHGNAKSVARILSAVTLGGTVDGVSLLSPKTIDVIFRQQTNGTDIVLDVPVRRGIGYALADPVSTPILPNGRICFWGGWGGSQIIMDLDRAMTISYVMNKMGPGILGSPRGDQYVREIYEAIP